MSQFTEFDVVYAIVGGGIIKDGDKWTFCNGQEMPSEEAIQAKLTELQAAEPMRVLREQRNRNLAETDWWCTSDRSPTQAQLDYRQALRDLPATASPSLDENEQLTNVTWPVKPE